MVFRYSHRCGLWLVRDLERYGTHDRTNKVRINSPRVPFLESIQLVLAWHDEISPPRPARSNASLFLGSTAPFPRDGRHNHRKILRAAETLHANHTGRNHLPSLYVEKVRWLPARARVTAYDSRMAPETHEPHRGRESPVISS